MNDQLQEGIYFRHKQTPAPAWRLLLLNIEKDASRAEAFQSLNCLWKMLQKLKTGLVADLNPDPLRPDDPECVCVPNGELTCLIGYGSRLFDREEHPAWTGQADLRPLFPLELLKDQPPFRNLAWVPDTERRQVSADIGLQFIAQTELSVSRAIMEICKHISDRGLPLKVVDFFSGFGRDDKRSWIDFHDGLNSMSYEDRLAAMEVKENTNVDWMNGGTFMAFLRLKLDLLAWRSLSREKQELVIGRDKLTGCPLVSTKRNAEGKLVGVKEPSCPFSGTTPSYYDPIRPSDNPVLLSSHIHRANLARGTPAQSDSGNRIYRQSYDFLEMLPDGKVSVGLNFVSFQSNADRIRSILNESSWLGDVNFGGIPGCEDSPNVTILSLISGLYFAVPPKADPFPGHTLFA